MSQYIRLPAASVTATNPSVGTTGTTAPSSATEIGGKSAGGNLVPVLVASDGTVAVSATALPLPSGAATSANQATEIASLASIDGKTPALGQALAGSSVPVVLTAAQLTTLTPLASVTVTQATGTNLHAVIDSGTVTANAGSGTFAVSAASLPLPSNAATSALQTTGNTSLASIDTKLTSPLSVAQSGTWTVQPGNTANTTAWLTTQGGRTQANAPVRNDYSTGNVTTGAYVQLVASTTSATSEIEIFDSSGQTLFLATGAAASEVNQIIIFPGGNGRVPLKIAAGTRVSIKAISATANSGEIDINFYA